MSSPFSVRLPTDMSRPSEGSRRLGRCRFFSAGLPSGRLVAQTEKVCDRVGPFARGGHFPVVPDFKDGAVGETECPTIIRAVPAPISEFHAGCGNQCSSLVYIH